MTAGSSSGPSRDAPTEVTCIPGASHSAAQDRLARIGAGADDVALRRRPPRTSRTRSRRPRRRAPGRARALRLATRTSSKLSHAGRRVDVRARLNTRAENGQHARVRPGERSRGDRRSGAGAHGRDLGPVHECERLRRSRRRRARSSPGGWAGRPRGSRRRPRRASSRGSRPRSRASPPRRPRSVSAAIAGRNGRAPGAELDERALERVEQLVEIEQPADLGAREDEHGQGSMPSAWRPSIGSCALQLPKLTKSSRAWAIS